MSTTLEISSPGLVVRLTDKRIVSASFPQCTIQWVLTPLPNGKNRPVFRVSVDTSQSFLLFRWFCTVLLDSLVPSQLMPPHYFSHFNASQLNWCFRNWWLFGVQNCLWWSGACLSPQVLFFWGKTPWVSHRVLSSWMSLQLTAGFHTIFCQFLTARWHIQD